MYVVRLLPFARTVIAAILAAIPATAYAGPPDSPAQVNSCSNVTAVFSYFFVDKLSEGRGLAARGTFQLPGEPNEAKQPPYNLSELHCNRMGEAGELECRLTEAVVGAHVQECSLDMQFLTFDMKEISNGILVGGAPAGSGRLGLSKCFNPILTVNRNTKRVSLSFERSQYPDDDSLLKGGMCASIPTTQILMNCGSLVPAYTKKTPAPGERICDFEDHLKKLDGDNGAER